jgi:transcriptional regulator with XRE-family HTH domain
VSDTSTIGERIKAVRLRAGLGQEAFAKALGCSKRALVSWELGGAEPPITLMVRLRRDYDVDPEWVILGDDVVPRSYYGPVDWDRLDRLSGDVDAICRDVGLRLPDERRQALARVFYDGGADAGAANRKQLRGMLLALSLGD